MAKKIEKKSFILYSDLLETISILSLEQKGLLFDAILQYESGLEVDELDPVTNMAFTFIKQDLDRNDKKYEATRLSRSEAGKKSAEAKKKRTNTNCGEQIATNSTNVDCVEQTATNSANVDCVEQTATNSTVSDNLNENVTGNDNSLTSKESDIKEIFEYYNRVATPSLTHAKELTPERKAAIEKALESFSKDKILQTIDLAKNNEFLCGAGPNNWIANLDWLIKPTNLLKIQEGAYKTKISSFNQMSKHNYDIDELEKRLLAAP